APAALAAVFLTGLAGWAIGELAGRAPWSPAAPGRPRAGRAGLAYVAIAELYLLALATGGVILWGFLTAGGAADPSLLGATATWALAAALGTLLGLIPGSIGAREITLFVVLVGALGAPVAALVAVLFRLLFVAGDLLWGATLLLLARRLAGPELRDAAG
ncbi:MAG TPA: hypothetical protein VG370_10530, partial [Chloroflexota bacterium]|nr:hypothetical protein [Chloroflexota bacterium]